MIGTFIIGLICVFLAFLARYSNFKYGLECAFILLTIFLSIRYDWGNDYSSYLSIFQSINSHHMRLFDLPSLISYSRNNEYGWTFLNVLFAHLGFFSMVIFLTVVENLILYRFIKKHVSKEWYWFTLFIYIFTPSYMLIGASMMRQFLVMILYLIAVDFICSKKIVYFILIILLASTIHISALILLPTYFVRYLVKIKVTRLGVILMGIIGLCWFFITNHFAIDILAATLNIDAFKNYQIYIMNQSGMGTASVLTVCIWFTLFVLLLNEFSTQSLKMKILFLLCFIYFLVEPLIFVVPMFGRIAGYFGLFTIAVYPCIISNIKNLYYRNGLLALMVLTSIKTLLHIFYSDVWHDHFFIYKTIFDINHWM